MLPKRLFWILLYFLNYLTHFGVIGGHLRSQIQFLIVFTSNDLRWPQTVSATLKSKEWLKTSVSEEWIKKNVYFLQISTYFWSTCPTSEVSSASGRGGNQYFSTPQNDRQSLRYNSSTTTGSKRAFWAFKNSNFRSWPNFGTLEVPKCPQGSRWPPTINSQNHPQLLETLKLY